MNNRFISELVSLGVSGKSHVITFGCQQNEADSERVRGMLTLLGYRDTDVVEEADVIIVNTCAIREHAEMKALSILGNFKALKRKNPDLIVGVIGCMSAEEKVVEHIKQNFHYVTFTIEPGAIHRIPEVIYNYKLYGKRSFIYGDSAPAIVEGIPVERKESHRAWVSIMYGCNNFCSYCIVPYTRGRERSRKKEDILDECKALVEGGCREITLLGQNVNSYKADTDFAGLLSEIAAIPGDFLIRFMTSHPKDVSDELIRVMAENREKIAPYFHLPLQSGSNRVLKAMNRRYDRDRFISVAKRLREAIPGICLSTDVIVGFPGEDEEDFEDTLDVLSTVEFDMVYAFIYSKREGTPAAVMQGQVAPEVASRRLSDLFRIQDEISIRLSKEYEGRVERVLVDSFDDGVYSARTGTNKLVHFKSQRSLIGEFVDVLIEEARAYTLIAKEII